MRPDLRELDRRVVPGAARALRRLLDRAGGVRDRAGLERRRVLTAASRTARRADARVTAAGPLAVLRDVPQLALLVVVAVLLSGIAAAVLLDRPAAPATATAARSGGVERLGVLPGENADRYLAQNRTALDDLAEQVPDVRLLAVVHLARYVEADQVAALLEGTDPQRLYLRASNAGPDAEIVLVPATSATIAAVLPALCRATSSRKAEDGRNFTALADSLEPATREEQQSRAAFQAEAVRARSEAQAYAGSCATTFAAVVQAPAAALRRLLASEGVRGVEAAPPDVELVDVDVEPLLPETTGVVPAGRER